MDSDLRARIAESLAVVALAARVDWIDRPQSTSLPAVTLQRISPGRRYTHEGADGLSGPRMQADCWGGTAKQASDLARAVIAAVEPAGTKGSTRFSQSFLVGERDLPPESLPGGAKAYRRSLDFNVWHQPV